MGSAPNGANWTYDTGDGGWGNAELENYTTSLQNSQIIADPNATDGKSLAIIALDTQPGSTAYGTVGRYTSARLLTNAAGFQGVTFQYGYMEARIQMPYGDGIWPAFWMLGTSINTGTAWPNCGETDIMENIGKASDQPINHGSLHAPNWNPTGTYTLPGGALYHNAYHTFGVLWQPNQIDFYVDGTDYETQTLAGATGAGGTWEFNTTMFFLLNMAVGGNYPGSPDASTSFPQTMLVDYVRVYEPNTPTATPSASATSTPSGTPTPSPTRTATSSPTFSPSATASRTASSTVTNTASLTATATRTNTTVNSPTNSATASPIASMTPTATKTATVTPSLTASPTPTATPSATPANSLTNSPTFTPTSSATASPTPTASKTPTATKTATVTPSLTASPTPTATGTPSATPANSLTNSPTFTPTPSATRTPTAPDTVTPTATSTPTPSLTITSTPALSPTSSPNGVVIGLPYPNPVMGSGPVTVQVQAPAGSTVEWSVFTTAFRKIVDASQTVPGNHFALVWNLEDQWRKPVASGLYYLRVQVTGLAKTSKVLKVLVLR